MKTYLAFPVKIEGDNVVQRKDAGRRVEAQNAEDALREAQNHIPLFLGESIAIVVVRS